MQLPRWTCGLQSHSSHLIEASYWQHSGTTSSAGEGNSRMASLEDLLYPLWKIKAFFTVKKETVLSHMSELDTPVLSWFSSAEQSLTALSVHFLSKLIILHVLSRNKEKPINAVNTAINFHFTCLKSSTASGADTTEHFLLYHCFDFKSWQIKSKLHTITLMLFAILDDWICSSVSVDNRLLTESWHW